ncbi:MAG: hypothetical protein IPN53_05140 [Comamonadaceae bacterium]|nr:hypothetical protein [Comamonadaceae bacterium]
MANPRTPKTETPTTPDAAASAPMPGIGRIEIPRPAFLADDDVVMHDDLMALVSDSKASYCAVAALVTLLRSSNGDARADMLEAEDRRGLAELLDYVRARLELVVDNAGQVARVLGMPHTVPA